MSDPPAENPLVTAAEEMSLRDPLEEMRQRVRIVLSRPLHRVVLIVLFVVGTFVIPAVLSGVIEDLSATWFRENAADLLGQRVISNGWLLLFLV